MHTSADISETQMARIVVEDEATRASAPALKAHFNTEHLTGALGARAVRGGAATFVSQGFRLVLQITGTVVLARLLAPEDYGLFAIVLAVVSFLTLFKEAGFASATVQSAEVDHRQASALFWIGLAVTIGLAVLTAASAPLVAWVYGEPRLVWMMCTLACGFIFAGLGIQHRALLRRQMRFGALAIIDAASFAAATLVAIACALLGARYWSLILLHLVWSIGAALGAWIACDWRPGFMLRVRGVGKLLSFGGHLTGLEVVTHLSRNIDSLLLGWWWGARALGFYDKASQLSILPTLHLSAPVGSVAFPVLSRLHEDARRFRSYFEKCLLLTLAFSMPFVVLLFVTSERIIPFVFGAQWAASAEIFRAFAPAAFIGPIYSSVVWAMSGMGRTRRNFEWNLLTSAAMVFGFFCGVRWGAVGVAAAFSVSRTALLVPTLAYCYKDSPLDWKGVLRTVARPALASVIAGLLLSLFDGEFLLGERAGLSLIVEFVLYGLMYLGAWALIPGGRSALRAMIVSLRDFWRSSAQTTEGV